LHCHTFEDVDRFLQVTQEIRAAGSGSSQAEAFTMSR
jgi:hypothetical protein